MPEFEKPKSCVFCGRTPLSKEHVLPDWLKKHAPALEPTSWHQVDDVKFGPGAPKVISSKPGMFQRPGSPLSHRLRVVCEKCNNTWMSALQSKVKPILLPLVLGQWKPLSERDRETLAAWLTMFVMVVDFGNKDVRAITQEQRSRFLGCQKADAAWFMWIARYEAENGEDEFLTDYSLGCLGKMASQQAPVSAMRGVMAESHNGVVGIGRIIFHTFGSNDLRLLRFMSSHYSLKTSLSTLWPIYAGTLSKPPVALPLSGIDELKRLPSWIVKRLRDPWFGA